MVSKQWVKDRINKEMSENNRGHNLTNRNLDELERKVDLLFKYFDLFLVDQPEQKVVNKVELKKMFKQKV